MYTHIDLYTGVLKHTHTLIKHTDMHTRIYIYIEIQACKGTKLHRHTFISTHIQIYS